MKQHGAALACADKSFRKDKKIALEAVKNNADAFEWIDESLEKDADILKVVNKKK